MQWEVPRCDGSAGSLTAGRILLVAASVAVLAGLFIGRVTPGSPTVWVLCAVVFTSSFFCVLVVLLLVLSGGRRPDDHRARRMGTSAFARLPQFRLWRLMAAIAIVAGVCWFATFLRPAWSWAFHRPTNAEVAASLRVESEHWERLATENPSLSREYRRLAEQSRRAAERFDRRSKVARGR